MKKLSLTVLLMLVVITASAEKFGVWYGIGINRITGTPSFNSYGALGSYVDATSSNYFSALEFGVTYTHEMGVFDLTGGLSYRQKGTMYKAYNDLLSTTEQREDRNWRPCYLQLDILGTLNFIKNENFKLGVQTGPYCAYMVNRDRDNDYLRRLHNARAYETEYNRYDFGWQAGLAANYKGVTLSAGYSLGFVKVYKDAYEKCKNTCIYVKAGYEFDL